MSARSQSTMMRIPEGSIPRRALELYNDQLDAVFRARDRMFGRLFVAQWAFAIGIAVLWSPFGWEGKVRSAHLHLYYAVILGAALTLPAVFMIRRWPGAALTRHSVAVIQMSWSALLIHLSGGRIETHFHVFGSLAFLAFYRDWKVLISATAAVSVDHLLRGLLWSESVYGITNPEWWRFLEHAFWVLFENVVLVMGIVESRRGLSDLAARQAELEALNEAVEVKVEERTEELRTSREQYRLLIETTKTIPWAMSASDLRFTYVGPQVEAMLGTAASACLAPGFFLERAHPEDRETARKALTGVASEGGCDFEARMIAADGRWLWVRVIGAASEAASGAGPDVLRGVMFDVTRNREMESQLRQAQKLESVGRLAAGIAHEINTPVQFVNDSVQFVRDAAKDLSGLVDRYREVTRAVIAGAPSPDAARDVAAAEEEVDLEYLLANVPKALNRSIEGLGRVATIVRSMKEFAHPDQKTMAAVDLNESIRSTLTIARHEYKYVADLVTDFDELPSVTCYVGEMNQAVLNIVVNASHAIADVVKGSDRRGVITVRTRAEGETVLISISDTGGGIPDAIKDRVFDPFFTTKEVGRGTGQGLAIARSVVVDKHGGELTFETAPGAGTTFHLRLPVEGAANRLSPAAV